MTAAKFEITKDKAGKFRTLLTPTWATPGQTVAGPPRSRCSSNETIQAMDLESFELVMLRRPASPTPPWHVWTLIQS